MNTKVIQFPPATAEQDAKIKLFIKHLAELTGQPIEAKSMTITVVELPAEQKALTTMLINIAKNQENKINGNGNNATT